ncbi:MAG: hypothetical protein D6741_20115 [Planctomycetota bacterium]|nr:MAG: hypothetical protein D6741_20115 [Planctomycetota bacterium]
MTDWVTQVGVGGIFLLLVFDRAVNAFKMLRNGNAGGIEHDITKQSTSIDYLSRTMENAFGRLESAISHQTAVLQELRAEIHQLTKR